MKKNDNNINAFQWMHTIVLCSILFLGLNILKAQPTQVGDLITFPDGSQGIVCYIDNNNKKGWVVDLYDLAGTYKLYNSSNVPSAIPNQSYTYSHSVHNWDPTGKSNTLTLFQANNGYDYSPAAIAVDPESGWYIPDAEQMMMMLSMVSTLEKSFDKAGVGSITEILESGRLYWTSTKYSSNTFYNLGYLTYYVPIKTIVTSECTNEYYIRRVRDFDQMESAFVYWLDPEGKGTIQVGPDTTTTYDALVIYGKDTFDVQKTVVVHPAFHEEDTVTAIITDLSSTSGYYWLDSLYTESGTYTKIAYTKEGCDSINVLHLVLLDVDTTADTTCVGTPVDLTLPVTTRGEPLISGIPNIHIGDVLCTDGSVMRPNAYLSSSKTAMGVVFHVDLAEGIGRAIALSDAYDNFPMIWASNHVTYSDLKTTFTEASLDMEGKKNTNDILRTASIAVGTNYTADYAPAAHHCKFYNHHTYTTSSYLIRAAMHTRMGEDGKALADWKAALSRMDDVTGIDACVCLMAKTTSDMIVANELEFKKFDFIAHIDRMADMLDEKLGCSCKGHLYASVLADFLDSYGALSEGEKENCEEVFIPMLKRLAVYGRDLGLVRTLSMEVLETMEYEDSSYESDDNYSLRVFYVICGRIVAYLPELGRCDFPSGWTDADMKAKLEPYLDAILACEEGVAPLDKYLKRIGIEGTMTVDQAVDDYVQRYLRMII